jgi:hypothetical protein
MTTFNTKSVRQVADALSLAPEALLSLNIVLFLEEISKCLTPGDHGK